MEFVPEWPYFEGQALGEEWICPYRAKLREEKKVANFLDLDPGLLLADSYAMLKLRPDIVNEVAVFPLNVD